MAYTKNKDKTLAVARALLKDRQLDGDISGMLTFKGGDAEPPAYLQLSTNSRYEVAERVTHFEGARVVVLSEFPVHEPRLRGNVVRSVDLEGNCLTITFTLGDRLVPPGDVDDPDVEGWSVSGYTFATAAQDIIEAWPCATIRDWVASLFPGCDDWQPDEGD